MKWSEVIMVRSAGSNAKILAKTLQDLTGNVAQSDGHGEIQVFRREKLDTDICIVLFHNEEKSRTGGSPLGLRLTAALKEFGLVHHTVWKEC